MERRASALSRGDTLRRVALKRGQQQDLRQGLPRLATSRQGAEGSQSRRHDVLQLHRPLRLRARDMQVQARIAQVYI